MDTLTRIDWQMWSGPDDWDDSATPIWIELYRDDCLLHRQSLDDRVVEFPETDFPEGVRGHLRVLMLARGDTATRVVDIRSTVRTAGLCHQFEFMREVVQIADEAEGFQAWMLTY
jgi:hypothetical protein